MKISNGLLSACETNLDAESWDPYRTFMTRVTCKWRDGLQFQLERWSQRLLVPRPVVSFPASALDMPATALPKIPHYQPAPATQHDCE